MTQSPSNHWETLAKDLYFETRAFIGGDYDASTHKQVFQTENPACGEILATFPDGDTTTIDRAVVAARDAFPAWRALPPHQRKNLLLTLADQINAERETLALLDCLEMGMPITMALAQVDDALEGLRYNAELIDKVYGDLAPADPATTLAFSQREPRGVVGIISPWNFPFSSAMIAIAPALAAGNTLVVKPSEQTPSSLLKLAEIAMQAGLPPGVVNVVPGRGSSAGAALARHCDVDMLHFTGSTAVGRQLMVSAGQSNGKPLMLELGGKSPQIVFEDAAHLPDLGANLAQAAFYNSGQLCVAKTRLLVHNSIKDDILAAITDATKKIFTLGNPLDKHTTFGPMASQKQFGRVKEYLHLGQKEGARLHQLATADSAASSQNTQGYFMQPALFDQVDNRMRLAQEEIFGPVLSVISFNTEEEAIQLANGTPYGLAATAWTQDLGRARRLSRDLHAGYIDICASTKPATPTAALSGEPFGESGFGVLGGKRGLDPYTRLKAVQLITD